MLSLRNEAVTDNLSVDNTFKDLFSKYNRTVTVIETFKEEEEDKKKEVLDLETK